MYCWISGRIWVKWKREFLLTIIRVILFRIRWCQNAKLGLNYLELLIKNSLRWVQSSANSRGVSWSNCILQSSLLRNPFLLRRRWINVSFKNGIWLGNRWHSSFLDTMTFKGLSNLNFIWWFNPLLAKWRWNFCHRAVRMVIFIRSWWQLQRLSIMYNHPMMVFHCSLLWS